VFSPLRSAPPPCCTFLCVESQLQQLKIERKELESDLSDIQNADRQAECATLTSLLHGGNHRLHRPQVSVDEEEHLHGYKEQ
ncbi:uncharacterized protein V6R79_007019, partial [Siganus canaliculatus]